MCVCMCVLCTQGVPGAEEPLPVIFRSLLSLPANTHKACHVDQVAAGPKPFCDCVHMEVWLYNCSLIFCFSLQCTTEQQCVSALSWIERLLCFWRITSVWPVYYAVSVQRGEAATSFSSRILRDGRLRCSQQSDRLTRASADTEWQSFKVQTCTTSNANVWNAARASLQCWSICIVKYKYEWLHITACTMKLLRHISELFFTCSNLKS